MIIRTKIKKFYLMYPWQLKLRAHRRIVKFKMSGDELALDKFIKETYNASLKLMCINLLDHIKVNINDGEFTAYFNSKDWDKIAILITYGNGKINGSKILRNAFSD